MNTRKKVARILEKEMDNVGDPPRGDQVPPLKKDANDEQAPVNPPPLTDGEIRDAFFHMDQAITMQA